MGTRDVVCLFELVTGAEPVEPPGVRARFTTTFWWETVQALLLQRMLEVSAAALPTRKWSVDGVGVMEAVQAWFRPSQVGANGPGSKEPVTTRSSPMTWTSWPAMSEKGRVPLLVQL